MYRNAVNSTAVCRAHGCNKSARVLVVGLGNILLRDQGVGVHAVPELKKLALPERINCGPKEFVVIGVEPRKLGCGLELTQEVKQSIPQIVNTVLEEIRDDIYTE